VRRLLPVECERLQGFPESWTLPDCDSNSEDSDEPRYHALGNAVTVPVVEWLATRIRSYLSESRDKWVPTIARSAVAAETGDLDVRQSVQAISAQGSSPRAVLIPEG
jgi:hypothetical protein